jgi:hypothetical protein
MTLGYYNGFFCAVTAVVVTTFALSSNAATIPDAYATVQTYGGTFAGPPTLTSFQQDIQFDGSAVANATSGAPSVGGTASGTQFAIATLDYYFDLAGPANLANIPASASGVVFAYNSNPGDGGGTAMAEISSGGAVLLNEIASTSSSVGGPSHFFKDPILLSSNTIYDVTLQVGMAAAECERSHRQARASYG